MGKSAPVIVSVETPRYQHVLVRTADERTYEADLSSFAKVYCFPKKKEWSSVSIDGYGLGLIWSTRFEVHLD